MLVAETLRKRCPRVARCAYRSVARAAQGQGFFGVARLRATQGAKDFSVVLTTLLPTFPAQISYKSCVKHGFKASGTFPVQSLSKMVQFSGENLFETSRIVEK